MREIFVCCCRGDYCNKDITYFIHMINCTREENDSFYIPTIAPPSDIPSSTPISPGAALESAGP
jgi:hypothetical protein